MTAVNAAGGAAMHEPPSLRLQPYSGAAAVFMYSTAADGSVTLQLKEPDDLDRGSLAAVLARLQDADPQAALSIAYQDTAELLAAATDPLGMEVLLGTTADVRDASPAGAGQPDRDRHHKHQDRRIADEHHQQSGSTAGSTTAAFDLFDSSSGPDLTLSPQTFTNTAEAFINDNSNSLGVPAGTDAAGDASVTSTTSTTSTISAATTTTTDGKKALASSTSEIAKLAVKRQRPKAASPNRQGPQQCQVCAKVFGNASALAKHKLTHSDERKYVCTMCGKAFKRQDHLNGHMLTHRNKKPYECKAEGCGKSYCDARSLRRHTENHHGAGGGSNSAAPSTLSPAQGQASGDAASPHGSHSAQYAQPAAAAGGGAPQGSSGGKSQLQQLLATEPVKSSSGGGNDGLTKQQLDLIHQIMEQTQRQSQPGTTANSAKSPASGAQNKQSAPKTHHPVVKAPAKTSLQTHQRVSPWSQQQQGQTGQQHQQQSHHLQQQSQHQSKSSGLSSGGAQQSRLHHPQSLGSQQGVSSTTPSKPEPKPVECNLCHRKFKNIPALNGHMRLHGGYFKKDAENKKCEKKDSTGPPLQTASVSVRALIEEKIINKRISGGDQDHSKAPPLFPLSAASSSGGGSNDLDAKITSFVVPAPPQPQDKARRHSDAEAFNMQPPPGGRQEAEVLADLILKQDKVSVKRATSDPGESSQIIQFQSTDSFTLAYQSEDGEFLSHSLQDDVFTQVPDAMLLQGVDPQQLASIQFHSDSLLQDQTDQQLQDITLDDYTIQDSVVQSPSYSSNRTVNQELQAVLDSPLPESLAEFSTFHSTNNLEINSPGYQTHSPAQYASSPHPSIAQSPLQSPLIRHDSPGFAYPTPPASHEGQSPCFGGNTLLPMVSPKQNNDFGQVMERGVDEPPQASSPLTAAFFTSTMSSSAEVEEALEEVLPGETISNDDIYPLSNSPQSPLGLTPVPSPLAATVSSSALPPIPTSSSVTFPHYTLQNQMLPNSDDPLLSSSPKDFTHKRKFEFNGIPLRLVSNNGLIDLNTANFTGILVDANGEIKLIQTSGNAFQTKNILVTNQVVQNQDSMRGDDKNNGPKAPKILKTVQIPTKQVTSKQRHNELKKEENNDVFLSPTTIPASPIRFPKKRPRMEPLHLPVLHQSKLRATRSKPQGCAPYTPQPILNPQRLGTGLYSSLVNKSGEESTIWSADPIPESDSTPHINVGHQFQCTVPSFTSACCKNSPEHPHEDLLWDPGIADCADNEVDMYLDFACCAAVPGGGRNREYAMHLLHLCGGNIHEAMLKLMQPSPSLPADHPLLDYKYNESDKWTANETDTFHKALLKYDKDFHTIAQKVGSKTVKQCIQFYYTWKKVCLDEYRKLKMLREKRNSSAKCSESDIDEKLYPDAKLLGIVDSGPPMPIQETRNFICEFSDCSASFNSRAALNGHIRIHGGTVRHSPSPTEVARRASAAPQACAEHPEHYPCKICGKVFTKIKSRSAHMKSHRPADAESPKRPKDGREAPDSSVSSVPTSPFSIS